ncbi:MAG TPA: hypothetical protein VK184_01510 [Nostocaceae cyanobacterium]|nr:hypothetical protein [Nostocaceae cyanobacterium]
MKEIQYTFLSDGSSDKALMDILTWLLRENQVNYGIKSQWADLRRLRQPPKILSERIIKSIELYPCDLLFIHRDAETETYQKREAEIQASLAEAIKESVITPPVICVIPIRMQEAWLLFDEKALRNAAGNPNGKQPLEIPHINILEKLPDPKNKLHELLCLASGLKGRRLSKFSSEEVHKSVHRVAELIDDFSPLRVLSAFQKLEAAVKIVIQENGWCSESDMN